MEGGIEGKTDGKTGGEAIVSIDTGKTRSYVVVEERGEITKEGYTDTSIEGFSRFIDGLDNPTMIMETSSCFNGVLSMIEEHGRVVASYPFKVRLIAESVKKTDRIDAHTLLYIYEVRLPAKAIVSHKK